MAADQTPSDAEQPRDQILRLNALVDGELCATERARLAAEMAADRDLARAHATLARLKATVAATGEAGPAAAPLVSTQGQSARRRTAIAAALVGILATGGLAIWFQSTMPPEPHTEPTHTFVRASLLPADPLVPDLTVAGLKLAGIEVETELGAPAVTATYQGPRGCRLILRISQAQASMPVAGATGRRSWTADGLVYELTAFGMPTPRFAAVAGAAEHSVRGTKPDGKGLRVARAESPPCVG